MAEPPSMTEVRYDTHPPSRPFRNLRARATVPKFPASTNLPLSANGSACPPVAFVRIQSPAPSRPRMNRDIEVIQARIQKTSAFVDRLFEEVAKVVVGQKTMVERLLIGLLSDGHVLMEGVPGLAKTLTVRTLADAIRTSFQRIQFTPDLLPADLIGTLIYDPKESEFRTRKGPVFANVILADEINRSPAKVQSALLEAMQEHTVTIGDHTFDLPSPFLVLATQNPIDQEGTYPLPEAQVDRFMLKLSVGYPSKDDELEIMRRMSTGPAPAVDPVVAPEEIVAARKAVETIYMDSQVERYVVDLVFATREPKGFGLEELEPLVAFGGSPRTTICLAKTARAHAFLRHRGYVTPEDVRSVAMDVMRHRVILTYEAEAEETTAEDVVTRVLDTVEVP